MWLGVLKAWQTLSSQTSSMVAWDSRQEPSKKKMETASLFLTLPWKSRSHVSFLLWHPVGYMGVKIPLRLKRRVHRTYLSIGRISSFYCRKACGIRIMLQTFGKCSLSHQVFFISKKSPLIYLRLFAFLTETYNITGTISNLQKSISKYLVTGSDQKNLNLLSVFWVHF